MGLSRQEIDNAVKDTAWQRCRVSMKGKTTERKLTICWCWLASATPDNPEWDYFGTTQTREKREVQVLNYLNALSRGGLIEPVEQVRGTHLRSLLEARASRIKVIR